MNYDPESTQPRCIQGHLLEFVAEGYAICEIEWGYWGTGCFAWCLGTPLGSRRKWTPSAILGIDNLPIPAWVSRSRLDREAAINFIQQDMALAPRFGDQWDEEMERARLVEIPR